MPKVPSWEFFLLIAPTFREKEYKFGKGKLCAKFSCTKKDPSLIPIEVNKLSKGRIQVSHFFRRIRIPSAYLAIEDLLVSMEE